ncbi:uncharacterized protein TNIN_304231 [Trichonephila inaurata madagascariensis]|uniref:Uncharacterized protein n=1 Tax=Trichonephila inaurata madagascariensis TaxID=2747483 RepID=A0A8X6XY54_9ARAC|nr:uncharacterized protein TNIN_304231 [Trichonephila inaurata madagascariensis]
MCHENESWTRSLPIILLGLRKILRADFKATPAELLYGESIRLPCDFFEDILCSRSRGKVFKTAEESVEYLISEKLESEMFTLPPEVDELTDEEGFHDSETLDPSVKDVAGSIEISVPYKNHDQRETDLSNKSKKRSCSESGSNTRKKGKEELIADWKMVPPNYNFSDESNASKINYETAVSTLEGLSLVEIFEEFLSPTYLEHILTEREKYAKQQWKNKPDFSLTTEELKTFIGFFNFLWISYAIK